MMRILHYSDLKNPKNDLVVTYYKGKVQRSMMTHVHTYTEITFVLQGKVISTTESGSAEGTGPCIILNKENQRHRRFVNPDTTFECYTIIFKQGYLSDLLYDNQIMQQLLMCDINLCALSPDEADDLLFYVRGLYSLYGITQKTINEILLQKMLLCTIVLKIVRIMEYRDSSRHNQNNMYIKKVLIYIDKNYRQPIKISDLLDEFSVGRTKFTADFKRYTGFTVNNYIISVKLKKAKEYLLSGENVKDTAALCGFENVGYFISLFKKANGITPYQYKLLYIGNDFD